jgi:hypothetical protein
MANSVNANPNSSTTVTIPTSTGTTSSIFITGSGGSGGPAYSTNSNYNNTSIRNPSGKTVMEIPSGDPTVKITGEIEWNGEKLSDRLERIESMLHIPTRDVTMEEKYRKLKQIWDQYKTALEEYKTWQRLKDSK